jgi:ADP-dependent NAD(P)H-hydrate dehydratase / NAD(P)H-hydrate epimerase
MAIPVLTPAQCTAWDHAAESAGIPLATLMESAGRAAAAVIARRYADRLGDGALVAVGPGNNGGDGWVLARALHQAGISTWVTPAAPAGSELNQQMARLALAAGVRTVQPDGPWPAPGLLVDALLGTGARGTPRPPIASLVERLADLDLPLAAMDGPSGLDLETGVTYLPTKAELSITFGGLRRGHLLARDDVGTIVVVDIGHPPPDGSWPTLVTDRDAAAWLPRYRAGVHKGDRGRVVVIGGNGGMSGAIRITGRAAFGAGAGLVHAVAPRATIDALTGAEPDLQTLAHSLALPLGDELVALIRRADAVVIGPGLGRGGGTDEFVLAVLGEARAAVVDADALTVLAGKVERLRAIGSRKSLVLTPHHGEFRTLFAEHAGGQESDPWSAACGAANASAGTVLLKGVPTVVARSAGHERVVAAGNPGLATGGSGDLLSGLIGAFLAGGLEPDVAASLGAQALGRAAELAARRTSVRTLRPMDVMTALPDLWRTWEVERIAPAPPRYPVLLELELPQLY